MRLVFKGRGYSVYEIDAGILVSPLEWRSACTVVPPPPARAEHYLPIGVMCAKAGYKTLVLSPRTCCGRCAADFISNNLVGDVIVAVEYASYFLNETSARVLIYKPCELNIESIRRVIRSDPYKRVDAEWCLNNMSSVRRRVVPYAIVHNLAELKDVLSSLRPS